jgi:hypothetical protein
MILAVVLFLLLVLLALLALRERGEEAVRAG